MEVLVLKYWLIGPTVSLGYKIYAIVAPLSLSLMALLKAYNLYLKYFLPILHVLSYYGVKDKVEYSVRLPGGRGGCV